MLNLNTKQYQANCSWLKTPEVSTQGYYNARVRIFYQGRLINVVIFASIESAVRSVRSVSSKPYADGNKSYQIEPQFNNFYSDVDDIDF